MDEPIEIEFYYKQDEFVRGARYIQAKHKITWIFAVIFLFPFFVGTYEIYIRNVVTPSTIFQFLTLPGFLLFQIIILPGLMWYSRSGKQWRAHKQRWCFSKEGIEFENKDYETKLNWTMLAKLIETPEFFYIQYSTMVRSNMIPKRAFQSEEQMDAFVELFHQNVKLPKKRKR